MPQRPFEPTSDTSTHSDVHALRRDNPDVVGAIVIDGRGNVRSADAVSPDLVAVAVALIVPARDLLERLAAELGCGALRSFVVEGDRACLAFADVDGATTAVVLGQTGAAPGALRADAISLAAQVARRGGSS